MNTSLLDSFQAEAAAFMRRQLASGGFMARSVLSGTESDRGEIVALLSDGIALSGPFSGGQWDFDSGSVGAPRLPAVEDSALISATFQWFECGEVDQALASFVHACLQASPENICLFEDALRRASDPGLDEMGTDPVLAVDQVAHLLRADADQATILETIRVAKSWLSLGFIAAACPKAFARGVHHVKPRAFDALARQVDVIIVGAYDQEGYLLWNRQKPGQNC